MPRKHTASSEKRAGFVYILYNPTYGKWYKIGRTADILKRLGQYKSGMPSVYSGGWEYVRIWKTRDMYAAERNLLQEANRIRYLHRDPFKPEWFNYTGRKAKLPLAHIDEAAAKLKLVRL